MNESTLNELAKAKALIPGRAVYFQTWLSNGYEANAVVTGGRGCLTVTFANGELADDIELQTPLDARKLAAALVAMANEWEGQK